MSLPPTVAAPPPPPAVRPWAVLLALTLLALPALACGAGDPGNAPATELEPQVTVELPVSSPGPPPEPSSTKP